MSTTEVGITTVRVGSLKRGDVFRLQSGTQLYRVFIITRRRVAARKSRKVGDEIVWTKQEKSFPLEKEVFTVDSNL